MSTVAVTGASGFVGGAVVRRLAAAGHEVLAFGRRPGGGGTEALGVPYTSWDIGAGPLLRPPEVDAVVHCAAEVDDWGRASRFERANVQGTRNVLATWPRARFVHVSSASVYDPNGDHRHLSESSADPFDRTAVDRIRWLSHYGRTKRLAEHVVASEGRGEWVVLRPHAVFGPGDRTLLPRLLRRYRAGRLFVTGRPDTRLSVTHVENLASAVERAVTSDVSGVFNVADASPVRLDDLLEALLVATGRKPEVVYLPVTLLWGFATMAEAVHLHGALPRPVVTRYQLSHLRDDFTLDIARARAALGWRPHVDTIDGVRTLAGQRDGASTGPKVVP